MHLPCFHQKNQSFNGFFHKYFPFHPPPISTGQKPKARRHEWYRCIALWLGAPDESSATLVQVGCLEDEGVLGGSSHDL